ncbi:unnamed protein product [Prunus armeniaca]
MMIVVIDYFTNGSRPKVCPLLKKPTWSGLSRRTSFASLAASNRNGQAEASNKIVLDCQKKRLEDAEGKWLDELLGVPWAYCIANKTSIVETLFSLTYKTEAIIPPSYHCSINEYRGSQHLS